jgi:hypothetical protein
MTDNNKFIPKLPETKTEIALNQEQQNLQEQNSTAGKVVEAVKETVVPAVYASDDDDKAAKGLVTAANAAAIGIATVVAPPVGAGAAIGEGVAGAAMKASGDEEAKEAGEVFSNASTVGGGLGKGAAKAGEFIVEKAAEDAAKEVGKKSAEEIAKGATTGGN